jgi:dihydroorotate dehydrogenase (NAD+) catalytic subunit
LQLCSEAAGCNKVSAPQPSVLRLDRRERPVFAAAGALGYGAGWARLAGTLGDRVAQGALAGSHENQGSQGRHGSEPLGVRVGALAPLAPLAALAGIITGGVSLRSRGGAPPRLIETPAGVLYRRGAARLGVAAALRRHGRAWAAAPVPVIVNLVADAADEFAAAAAALAGARGVAAVELDLAGPDAATGRPFGHDPLATGRLVRRVRQACTLPVLVKLPADAPALADSVGAGAAAGAAAAVVAAGLPAGERPAGEGALAGALVGPATFPVILGLVGQIAPQASLPVIACGGVATAAHAARYLRAGAAAVQVGSAHLANPRAALDVAAALGMP